MIKTANEMNKEIISVTPLYFFRLSWGSFVTLWLTGNSKGSTAAEHIPVSFVHSDALHTVHRPSHIQTFGTWFLLIHYFHLAVAWKRWPMSSFSGLYPIFDNKKDHFLIENSHRQKNIDFSKNVLYHWNVKVWKSIEADQLFAVANRLNINHELQAQERHLIQFKVYYTFGCNNSQECRFMFWCEFDFFFDLNFCCSFFDCNVNLHLEN